MKVIFSRIKMSARIAAKKVRIWLNQQLKFRSSQKRYRCCCTISQYTVTIFILSFLSFLIFFYSTKTMKYCRVQTCNLEACYSDTLFNVLVVLVFRSSSSWIVRLKYLDRTLSTDRFHYVYCLESDFSSEPCVHLWFPKL